MSRAISIEQISCTSLYDLWSTEPDLIAILDLRSKSIYDHSHIPGSIWCSFVDLETQVENAEERLVVIVSEKESELEISAIIKGYDNVVLLKDCTNWKSNGWPVVENGRSNLDQNKIFNTQRSNEENMKHEIIFQQLFEAESSTYTYLIADSKTREAAIIDPVIETVERDIKLINELGLKLVYVLDTHIHADHVTAASELRKRTGAKTAVSVEAEVPFIDIPLEDGQELRLGEKKIRVISTPGHTNTCLTYFFEGMLFTGDSLMIRGCGRTDFQQGSSDKMFTSVHDKLYRFDDETLIYPGHDYKGYTSSTIGAEKKCNARLNLGIELEGFRKIMSELKLANPKKIHEAVPANLVGGLRSAIPQFQTSGDIPVVIPSQLHSKQQAILSGQVRVIDVRRPEEFNNELGHIKGAQLVTLGPDLTSWLEKGSREQQIIFVCRSGARSGNATAEALSLGYNSVANMVGGMIRWNEEKFEVEK